jgi:hypothetical protein
MHDGTIRMGDDWLRANLAAYAQWARTHNSLLIITFDETVSPAQTKFPRSSMAPVSRPALTTRPAGRCTICCARSKTCTARRTPLAARRSGPSPVFFPAIRQCSPCVFAGLNAYDDCTDTMLRMVAPTSNESVTTPLLADLDTDSVTAGNQPAQMLVRFENLFGSDPGQVPLNATIISAKLSMWTGAGVDDDSDDFASCHRMLVPWAATDTWNSLINGVQTDGSEAVSADTFTQMPELEDAPVILDVTSDIAAFLAGTPNHGWVLNCTGADSWRAVSMEGTRRHSALRWKSPTPFPSPPDIPRGSSQNSGPTPAPQGHVPTDDPDDDS